MAEPLKPIGFWSYTSSDDTSSGGRLSQLRRLLADELQLRIGRRQAVRLWQDVGAIPHGSDWLRQIHKALDESSFLIPIVTPAFLESDMCGEEVMRFRERERELGRDDLIFPIRYIDVADIAPEECYDPGVMRLLRTRQWADFASLRFRDPLSEAVLTTIGGVASSIRTALRRAVAPAAPEISEAPSQLLPVASELVLEKVRESAPALPRETAVPEMISIPAGSFVMGVPVQEAVREDSDDSRALPLHPVTIARAFWMGKYPMTWGQYATFVSETGARDKSWQSPGFPRDKQDPARYPVVNVSYGDAQAFVEWLSAKTGQHYHLPSEAQWEYAARAGTNTARPWGDDAGKPDEHAHFEVSTGTCPVGLFEPNLFGLHDMLGNVWEWTADPWHDDYKGAPADGSTWTDGGNAQWRVLRGGSWFNRASVIRTGVRSWSDSELRSTSAGFRVARTD